MQFESSPGVLQLSCAAGWMLQAPHCWLEHVVVPFAHEPLAPSFAPQLPVVALVHTPWQEACPVVVETHV